MLAIVGAVIGALIISILYYLALYVLNDKAALELASKDNRICSGPIIIVGVFTVLAWIVISLIQMEGSSLPWHILTMCIVWAMAVLTVTDWVKKTIPNQFLVLLLMIWAVIVGLYIILDINSGMALLFQSLAGAIIGGAIFLLCYFLSKKQLGAGDVMLVFVMGLFLAGQRIMGAIFYGVILCCIFSVIQLCRKKIGMKDGVPLVPFLYIGTLVTLLIL